MKWDGLTPPYATIVVDPPWHYDDVNPPNPGLTHGGPVAVGALLPYSSMGLDEIKALPVANVAAGDARLFLWTTNSQKPAAFFDPEHEELLSA